MSTQIIANTTGAFGEDGSPNYPIANNVSFEYFDAVNASGSVSIKLVAAPASASGPGIPFNVNLAPLVRSQGYGTNVGGSGYKMNPTASATSYPSVGVILSVHGTLGVATSGDIGFALDTILFTGGTNIPAAGTGAVQLLNSGRILVRGYVMGLVGSSNSGVVASGQVVAVDGTTDGALQSTATASATPGISNGVALTTSTAAGQGVWVYAAKF